MFLRLAAPLVVAKRVERTAPVLFAPLGQLRRIQSFPAQQRADRAGLRAPLRLLDDARFVRRRKAPPLRTGLRLGVRARIFGKRKTRLLDPVCLHPHPPPRRPIRLDRQRANVGVFEGIAGGAVWGRKRRASWTPRARRQTILSLAGACGLFSLLPGRVSLGWTRPPSQPLERGRSDGPLSRHGRATARGHGTRQQTREPT